MQNKLLLVSFLAAAITGGAITGSASAADAVVYEPAPEASVSSYDWSGFYAGVHAGYGWAKSETDDLFGYDLEPEGWLGGVQAGYNHQFANNVVIGLEADVSFGNLDDDSLVLPAIGELVVPVTAAAKIKAMGTVRGRIGYAFDRVLPYVTGGLGWARQDVNYNEDIDGFVFNVDQTKTHVGWTVGAGLEGALSDRWTAKVEYLYSDLGSEKYTGNSFLGPFPADIDLNIQTVKIGLNYQFN